MYLAVFVDGEVFKFDGEEKALQFCDCGEYVIINMDTGKEVLMDENGILFEIDIKEI